MMGKRLSKDEPLTEHDVAERLSRAALRVTNILMSVRQEPALMEEVKHSRYLLGGMLEALADELKEWGIGD